MGQIKPYRITYTAIGTTQPWAGYRIAGYSKDTPKIVLEDYYNNYAHNFFGGKTYKKYYDFRCLYIKQRKYMIFSKIDPCFWRVRHPCLRIDSVVCSFEETSELVKDFGLLLTIDRNCFDNILDFQKDGEAYAFDSEMTYEKAQTIYPQKFFNNNEKIELEKSISELFVDRRIYGELVKSIYIWLESSFYEGSLYIVCKPDMNYRIKLAVTLFNSLIYSTRKQISLEIWDDLHESYRCIPTLIFCEYIPKGANYYVVENGENNFICNVPDSFINRFDFINFFLANLNDKFAVKYFEIIENNLDEIYSDDIKESERRPRMREIEFAFSLSEKELNLEIIKSDGKLLRDLIDSLYINDEINSDKVDEYIAGLITEIINRKLTLNKKINKMLSNAYKKTKNKSLISAYRKYMIIKMCKFFWNRYK